MSERERSTGWTMFAMFAIGIAGVWNVVIGIAGLSKSEYFEEGSLLYQNLAFWGWVWLIVGALQVLTAILLAFRMTAGTALGLIGASVSMLVWFFSIGAHPVSSILIIGLDVLILYALTAEGPVSIAAADQPSGRPYEPPVGGPKIG